MAHQRPQTAPVTGGQHDGVRVQPRPVNEDDLVAIERLDRRDNLNGPIPDGVNHIHVDQRRHLLEPFHPRKHALFRDRQPELAEVAEIRAPRPPADRVGDADGEAVHRQREQVTR